MIPSAGLPYVPDVPRPIVPPGEGRTTGMTMLQRAQPPAAAFQGDTAFGQPQPAASTYEDRPPRLWQHDYSHDQTLGMDFNDGEHVIIGVHPGLPRGTQEPSQAAPQRPTFRTPPESWTTSVEAL